MRACLDLCMTKYGAINNVLLLFSFTVAPVQSKTVVTLDQQTGGYHTHCIPGKSCKILTKHEHKIAPVGFLYSVVRFTKI